MWIISSILVCCILVSGCGSEHGDYVKQLRSGTPEQRAQAASFLGAQRIANAVPYLKAALQDENAQVRVKVIWALGTLRSKRVLKDLLPVMQNENRNIRQATALALMQIEEPDALQTLQGALLTESDVWVAKDIKRAIAHLGQFEGEADIRESSVRGEFF